MIETFKKAHPIKQAIITLWAFAFGFGIAFSLVYLGEHGIKESFETLVGNDISLWTVGIFWLLFALRNIFFIPVTLLIVMAPLIFGDFWLGVLIAGIGEIIGASVGFLFARYYGQEFFEEKQSKSMQIVNEKLDDYGVISIVLLRFIPIFPFDLINFGAGLSRIKFRDYLGATSLAIWPDCIFYGTLGNAVQNPLSLIYSISIGIFLILIFWYLKNHPEYRKLFIMELKKRASRTRRKLRNIIRGRKGNRKKRF